MRTTVCYSAMDQSLSDLRQAAKKLSSIGSDVQSVCNRLSSFTGYSTSSITAMKKAVTSIKGSGSSITRLCDAGEQAMLEYYNCEKSIAGSGDSKKFSEIEKTRSNIEVDWKPILSIIGQFGIMGGTMDALFSAANDPKAIGKSVTKLVGNGAKVASKISDGKLIDIWGTSTVDAIGFSENLAVKLDGYIINNPYNSSNMSVAAKNAANVGAVAKWCGVAVSGMLNFAENVEEYNADFSNPRLYAETLGETAVDVGLGIFVGAAVAALAGASAPVWAVGVVSTGVVLGLDWVSEKIFEEGFSELVSDVVWDATEAVGSAVQKAGEFIGDAVSATANRISAGWNKLKSWF